MVRRPEPGSHGRGVRAAQLRGRADRPRRAPAAARARRAFQVVAALARISAIVGMECPGRDSLLSQVTVDITPGARAASVDWRVTRADRLLRLARLAIRSDGVVGTVQAFVRRPPAPAPDIKAVSTRVPP